MQRNDQRKNSDLPSFLLNILLLIIIHMQGRSHFQKLSSLPKTFPFYFPCKSISIQERHKSSLLSLLSADAPKRSRDVTGDVIFHLPDSPSGLALATTSWRIQPAQSRRPFWGLLHDVTLACFIGWYFAFHLLQFSSTKLPWSHSVAFNKKNCKIVTTSKEPHLATDESVADRQVNWIAVPPQKCNTQLTSYSHFIQTG